MAPQENDPLEPQQQEEADDYVGSIPYQAGRALASPDPGEEIVISGLAGKYPDSDNVYEFRDNLYTKTDMVSYDSRRWEPTHPEIPQRTGKLYNVNHFDPGFFGIHHRQAEAMDPIARLILERSVEAVLDAGMHPSELAGTRTGVFVGACFSESEKTWFFDNQKPQYFSITGNERSMIANRISYALKLNGPSFITDTACSSSLYALDQAYKSIRNGTCDYAIVGGSNVCLHPFVSLQFARLGVLSPDGTCKVFDNAADGYARSEAIVAIFLQRAKSARRIYAHVVHAKTNCDGFKPQSITYPSGEIQKRLLQEFYAECGVHPSELSFLEAHGTGTKVGDPEELQAIVDIFLEKRTTPLLIGSVKSNIGHSEPSSGLCSITKAIIGMENGLIPPNIHFSKPREGIEALEKGRLKVVTNPTPFEDDRGLIGVNSFGFGGGNAHVLLRWHDKPKTNKGTPIDDLPRLVCFSGRIPEAITAFADDFVSRPLDAEHARLLHQIFAKNIDTHLYRGWLIAAKTGEIARACHFYTQDPSPVYLGLTSFGPEWHQIIRKMEVLPIFQTQIQRIHEILTKRGFDLIATIKTGATDTLSTIIGNMAAQIALVNVFRTLQLEIEGYFGVGIANLICAHLDGALTLEAAILLTYDVATKQTGLPAFRSSTPKWLRLANNSLEGLKRDSVAIFLGVELPLPPKSSITPLSPTPSHGLAALLQIIGVLYVKGHDFALDLLYPKIEYPVSRGTPMISPLIKWDHRRTWYVTFYDHHGVMKCGEWSVGLSHQDEDWAYIAGHVIDGRNLFPATGYLMLAWDALSKVTGMITSDMRVVFENIKFLRATTVPRESKVELTVMVQRGTGNFEVIEGGVAIVTGRIYQYAKGQEEQVEFPAPLPMNAEKWLPLKTKDIYKELRLRGYNYKGEFKRMVECDNSATVASIRWDQNWVAFMDVMLQMKILQIDTRYLYVPTAIRRLTVDAKEHIAYSLKFGEDPCLPVYINKDCDIIKCGAIEIRGLMANSIARRKQRGDPVLETYKFVPNIAALPIDISTRVNVQLALENLPGIKVKVVELIDEGSVDDVDPLSPIINSVLGDLPLIQPSLTILTSKEIEVPNIPVENKKLITETDSTIVVGSKLLQRVMILNQAFGALKENGYIISREPIDFIPKESNLSGIDILTVHTIAETNEKIYFLRKRTDLKPPTQVDISGADFAWLPALQKAVKNDAGVIVTALATPLSGILGLVNCIRREPGCTHVRAIFTTETTPPFDAADPFYADIVAKNMAINVWHEGAWGTYRHLLLPENQLVESAHVFCNTLQRGDLSSLKWIEGPLTADEVPPPEKDLAFVYYSALNFRDVMTASGRISADVITRDRTQQEFIIGFEYSGRTKDGSRVMGISSGALSTMVMGDRYLTWPVPDFWKLEEAATVPAVYATILYTFFVQVNIKKGESILIHAGSGGIGQAAISVCLHYGLRVYTTCGTPEKRAFLLQTFPQLTDRHIGNSRDTSFEQLIFTETHGHGVTYVLNSLAEEKLIASVRCLAHGGQFLEIGKFDLASNNPLRLALLAKDATFHGIMVDSVFAMDPKSKLAIATKMIEGIQNGSIRPLCRTIFKMDEVEQAFRFMAGGKHIGKVLVEIKAEEEACPLATPTLTPHPALPRYTSNPNRVQVIVGGLGGFGLELADWLILRGARLLVLTSRSGVTNGYQAFRIRTWAQYNAHVHVSTADVTTAIGCQQLIDEAHQYGDIESIFNLAVVLRDQLLENQTIDNYVIGHAPKAIATAHLDQLTRAHCPTLRDFVVFSSVSCGRGNAGQSNYGMANSIMERICEQRARDALPALAIQWGAIGDVGLVAEMQEENTEMEIGGTLQQRIFNCLHVLDTLLRQSAPVVSSMVVAEKRAGHGGADNIVDAVAAILGLGDLKTVSLHASLSELGMDSMTAVEIKQTLEREYEVFLTPQDIRTLTFARLQEIQEERASEDDTAKKDRPLGGFEMIVRLMNTEVESKEMRMTLPSRADTPLVVFFPGLEGVAKVLEPLAENIRGRVECVQYLYEGEVDTIPEMADRLLPQVEALVDRKRPFVFVAYSFGAVVAMEVVARLEGRGYAGTVCSIDGSVEMLGTLLKNSLDVNSEAIFQTGFLMQLMSLHTPLEAIMKNRERLLMANTFDDRLNICEEMMSKDTIHSADYLKCFSTALYKRLKALAGYTPTFGKVRSEVKLFKPSNVSIQCVAEDYKLGDMVEGGVVEVRVFKGNHVTILNSLEMADCINEVLVGPIVTVKETILDAEALQLAQMKEVKQI